MRYFNPSQRTTIAVAFLLVIAHGVIGHFLAPLGLFTTMVIAPVLVVVLASAIPSFTPWQGCMVYYCLWAAGDVLFKLYSGGNHDGQGQGWTFMTTGIGLSTATPLIIIWIKAMRADGRRVKISAFIVLAMLVGIHLYLTKDLGLGRSFWYGWNELY